MRPADLTTERSTAVSEEYNGEMPCSILECGVGSHGDAVFPVLLDLDGERGEGGAEEVSVEAGVVTPLVGGGVGEDGAVDGRRGGVGKTECGCWSRGSFGPRTMPECPCAEPELGDEVVVVVKELTSGVVEKHLKKSRKKVNKGIILEDTWG